MNGEEWRPVPSAPDYEVSNLGRVVSHRRRRPRVMKASANDQGYPAVAIVGPSGPRTRRVHQLVAEAFIGPRPDGHEVRHLDGDKLNLALSNLAYGTRSDNTLDQVRHGRHALARRSRCINGHPFDDLNTYVTPQGKRGCRTCQRAATRAWKQRQRLRSANVSIGCAA